MDTYNTLKQMLQRMYPQHEQEVAEILEALQDGFMSVDEAVEKLQEFEKCQAKVKLKLNL